MASATSAAAEGFPAEEVEEINSDEHVLLQGSQQMKFLEGKALSDALLTSGGYSWDHEADLDVEELKRELDEQELLVDKHGSYLSGNEAELEGMIKMLRAELEGCREQRWRMEEASELSDFKDQLLVSMVPPQPPAGAGAGAEQDDEEEATPQAHKDGLDFSELEEINSELDEELSSLMSKLGQVKGEFAELNEQRQRLLAELETFTAEEDELLGSLDEERAALEELQGEQVAKGAEGDGEGGAEKDHAEGPHSGSRER